MSNLKFIHISNPKLLLSFLLKNILDDSLKKLENKSVQETSDIFSLKKTSNSLINTLSNLSIPFSFSPQKTHNKNLSYVPPDSTDEILNTVPCLNTSINFYKSKKEKKDKNSILKTLIAHNKTPVQVSKFIQKENKNLNFSSSNNINNNINLTNNNTSIEKRSNKKILVQNTPMSSVNIKKNLITNLTSSSKISHKFMLSNYEKKTTTEINQNNKNPKTNINKAEFLEYNNDTTHTPVLKMKFEEKKSKISPNKKKSKIYSPRKNKLLFNVTTGRKKFQQSDTRSLTPLNSRKHRIIHNNNTFDLDDKKSNYIKKAKKMKTSSSFARNENENNKEYNINTINQELEMLCNSNNLMDNDIRLDELKINETPPQNLSPKFKPIMEEQSDDKLKLLCDSLLKIVNKDELLVHKNRNSKIFSNLFLPNVNLNNARKSFAINPNTLSLLTLEEKLEGNIEFIIDYLNIFDLFNFCRINKEFFKIIIKIFVEKTERKIEILNEYINYLKPVSSTDISLLKSIKPFECNQNSIRAITLLNSISKNSLFSYRDVLINNKDIELIFDLYFIALGKKMDLMKFENNLIKKWQYICRYFRDSNFNLLGYLIQKDLIHKTYSNEIINTLYECAYDSLDKITPNYYQKINKNIAIMVFIIRDLLEFYGIGQNISSNSVKLFTLHSVRLEVQEKLLNKFNKLLKIIE